MTKSISRVLIKKFSPFDSIPDQHMDRLMALCQIESVPAGGIVLKQKESRLYRSYLIRGKVEVRRSFHERVYLDQDASECSKSLNELLTGAGVVRAKSNCQILKIDNRGLEELLSWNVSTSYQIAHLEEGEFSLGYFDKAIDDDYENDWTEVFLQSPLATGLNAKAISELFRKIEDIEVKAGDRIIEQHSTGDYFYIIKQGEARVALDVYGPLRGQCVSLGVGRYFGDEALIADVPRNASVTMTTDGVLGRLGSELFSAVVKRNLVSPISAKQVAEMDVNNYQCIDVRFSVEFRDVHSKMARNIPITHLRQHLGNFELQKTYIVGPTGDKRSELGTYLLRQAGFNAFCLQ